MITCTNVSVLFLALLIGAFSLYYENLKSIAFISNSYGAKIACSLVFLSNRTLESVLWTELMFPPVFIFTTLEIHKDSSCVSGSSMFGETRKACFVSPDLGCSLKSEGYSYPIPKFPKRSKDLIDKVPYPYGEYGEASKVKAAKERVDYIRLQNAADELFNNTWLHTRALLVIKDGHIILERYGDGATKDTRLLGWSMTKSWLGTLVGRMIHDGYLPDGLDTKVELPEWKDRPALSNLTIRNMLNMADGLDFDEFYYPGSDAPNMLFMSPSVALKRIKARIAGGQCFQYSSLTTNLLSRFLWHVFETKFNKTHEDYLKYPREALFDPLGMRSALVETDPSGVMVYSSFGWATARDWGRFGMLYLNNGTWNGKRLLPENWTRFVSSSSPQSKGIYGGHFWKVPDENSEESDKADKCNSIYPSRLDPPRDWLGKAFPKGTYLAMGFEEQYVIIIPEANAVVVKIGAVKELVINNDLFYDKIALYKDLTHSLL